MTQTITSAATSLKQVPAILRLIDKNTENADRFWSENSRVLDYGGGKYDELTKVLADRGVTSMVYDPFNRDKEHNDLVWRTFVKHRAHAALCSNVLNVIKEPAARLQVLRNLKFLTYGTVFFTVYEGDKSSRGRKTSKGWQANRPTKNYVREIRKEFESVVVKGKLICARSIGSN